MLQNDQFELNVIVGVDLDRSSSSINARAMARVYETHPVLRRLSNECTLSSTGTAVSQNGMTSRSNEVIQPRELDDESVVVLLVEGSLVQVFSHELTS